ncbi:MAG: penicillin-binding transpeptidase domain-containing protein [Ornithinimicrobium sp.]
MSRAPHRGRRNVSIGPTWALIAVVVALGGILIARLVQWQVVEQADLTRQAGEANTREVLEPALRGRILDAAGDPLAANAASTVVTVDPTVLAEATDEGRGLLAGVARNLGLDPEVVWGRTRVCGTEGAPAAPGCFSGSPFQPVVIARDVAPVDALSLVERPEDYPGVAVQSWPVRDYPAEDVNAAHLLGYLGRPSQDEVDGADPPLAPEDLVGRAGLEATYDTDLRGQPQRTLLSVDPRGIVTGQISQQPAVPGRDLRTHIDAEVQARTESVLRSAVRQARAAGRPARAAAGLVMRVDSGAVVAAASWPTYDPAIWTAGIAQSDYDDLVDPSGGEPLVNRLLGETYPPASTFKAFSLQAALASGVDPSREYACPGAVSIAGTRFTNFESRAYGRLDLQRILEVSCDTVFYRWAFDTWKDLGGLSAQRDLRDPYILLAEDAGFGRRTDIDLPGEVAGTVPGRQTKREQWRATRDQICARAESGYPEVKDPSRRAFLRRSARENCADGWQYRAGDAVNFAIGQGDLAVTPLQLGTAYAAVANGGTLWTPQLAAGTQRTDGTAVQEFAAEPRGTVFWDERALQVVRRGLLGVNANGTGASAFAGFDLDSYPVAGKTGSAEALGARSTAWYVSYGPAPKPEYVVVVLVEEGGIGGEVAAPAAREIWETLRDLPPGEQRQ